MTGNPLIAGLPPLPPVPSRDAYPRATLIDASGLVVNKILLPLPGVKWRPPEGLTLGPDGGEVGDRWDGKVFHRPHAPPVPPTIDDIKVEAQERIIALFGASSFDAVIAKQVNMLTRAAELREKSAGGAWPLTEYEQSELAEIKRLHAAIAGIRSASNDLEQTLPADYRDKKHWI